MFDFKLIMVDVEGLSNNYDKTSSVKRLHCVQFRNSFVDNDSRKTLKIIEKLEFEPV